MSAINRALVKRAAHAASTALADAACIADVELSAAAFDAAIRADDDANAAIWAVGDDDPLFLEEVVADALGRLEQVIQLGARDFARRAAS